MVQISMAFSDIFNFSLWFDADHYQYTLGYILAILCGIIMLTELYTIITQKTEPDLLMLLLGGVIGGVVQGLTGDLLLSILSALCWLMIFSVYTIRESPVWRELMLASLISYLVVLGGRIIQIVLEWHARVILNFTTPEEVPYWGLTGQQWFGIAWNVFIYVFFLLCIIFFGRRFFLVSRLTSPQIIYLMFFALSYLVLYNFTDFLNVTYPGVPEAIGERVLFASFGTYEIMIVVNFLLYLVSGPLLNFVFGVKKVEDKRVLGLVQEVKEKLGIKSKIRVGKVKAPILNAFAFGAFFDKRIAFMSRDLSDFTDDDIRGIAGHELVHAQRVHTLWLFLLTTVTFAITKALKLPATTLDYIFDPNVGLDFLWYYLYNIVILVFSYLFVRILEGRADLLTMRAGYGKALAKSLVKLDGFYQGIASEMGLSVYLLTDKEQTKAEKIRFLGDAGRNMYDITIKPNKMDLLINLMASHPKSAYRVVALTDQEKLPPVKAAMLPLLLLIPFVRRKFLKELQESRSGIAELIDQAFIEAYGKKAPKQYDEVSHKTYQYKFIKGKNIVAVSKLNKKDYLQGKVVKLKISSNITTLVVLEISTAEGKKEITLSDYNIFEMEEGQKQLFKDGKFGIIKQLGTGEKNFAFKAQMLGDESEIKEMSVSGVPIDYFENMIGKDVLFLQKGVTRSARLDNIEFSDEGLAESNFTISIGNETKVISGKSFIIEFKPFAVYLKKGKAKQQRSMFDSLKGKQISFQTKDDLDTLLKGKLVEVKEDSVMVKTINETQEVFIERIEFIYSYEDTMLLIYKPNLSFVERIMMFFQNRKKLAYIIS